MSVREVLLSMSYREDKPKHWVKPVGLCLFLFREETGEWENWFRSIKGVLEVWERKQLPSDTKDESFLVSLKMWEAFTRIDLCWESNSQFQLSAIDL